MARLFTEKEVRHLIEEATAPLLAQDRAVGSGSGAAEERSVLRRRNHLRATSPSRHGKKGAAAAERRSQGGVGKLAIHGMNELRFRQNKWTRSGFTSGQIRRGGEGGGGEGLGGEARERFDSRDRSQNHARDAWRSRPPLVRGFGPCWPPAPAAPIGIRVSPWLDCRLPQKRSSSVPVTSSTVKNYARTEPQNIEQGMSNDKVTVFRIKLIFSPLPPPPFEILRFLVGYSAVHL